VRPSLHFSNPWIKRLLFQKGKNNLLVACLAWFVMYLFQGEEYGNIWVDLLRKKKQKTKSRFIKGTLMAKKIIGKPTSYKLILKPFLYLWVCLYYIYSRYKIYIKLFAMEYKKLIDPDFNIISFFFFFCEYILNLNYAYKRFSK